MAPRQGFREQMARRRFLRLSAGGAVAFPLLLEACSPAPTSAPGAINASATTTAGGPPVAATRARGRVTLPTYVAFQGPKPDLPATAEGVSAGFFHFPPKDQLVQSVKDTPGTGGDINAFTVTYNPPGPALESNPAWQEINKRLGARLNINAVPFADFIVKFNTILSSGDLPDIIYYHPSVNLANLTDWLKSSCADLTPYLSGDAVKDYPNLANLPPSNAKTFTVYNDGIYGVHNPKGSVFALGMFVHQEMLDGLGVAQIKNSDDFKRVATQLTNASAGRYALGGSSTGGPLGFFAQMFRAPNVWKYENGHLTRDIETEEYKEAVAYTRDLIAGGMVYPDVPSTSLNGAKPLFVNGTFAALYDGFPAFIAYYDMFQVDPSYKLRTIRPFAFDGGQPVYYTGNSGVGPVFFKKASPDRIKELLRVLNFLAAPFGTTEYLLNMFGVEGTDFTYSSEGDPTLTDQGKADTLVQWTYVMRAPDALYHPGAPDYAQVWHDEEVAHLSTAVDDPTTPYTPLSPSYGKQNGPLTQMLLDRSTDILWGRAPVSSWDQVVQDWRSQGGDAIRSELEQVMGGNA
ncbi:MAG: hypothetical protein JO352_22070 [Chloroflexi bacterium]|nr:hypothetical protein [Chloroflexota bacterium]